MQEFIEAIKLGENNKIINDKLRSEINDILNLFVNSLSTYYKCNLTYKIINNSLYLINKDVIKSNIIEDDSKFFILIFYIKDSDYNDIYLENYDYLSKDIKYGYHVYKLFDFKYQQYAVYPINIKNLFGDSILINNINELKKFLIDSLTKEYNLYNCVTDDMKNK